MFFVAELPRPLLFSAATAFWIAGCAIDDRTPETSENPLGTQGTAMSGTGGSSATPAPTSPAPASPSGSDAANGAMGNNVPGGASAGSATPPAGEGPGAAVPIAAGGAAGSSNVPSSNMPIGNVPVPGADAGVGSGAPPCSGCVELVVPVTGPEQSASFRYAFAAPGLDFSQGSVTWRVQVPQENTNTNFFLTTDVQNGTGAGIFENYNVLSLYNFTPGEWVDLRVDVSAHPPRMAQPGASIFDYQVVQLVSLTLGTTDMFDSTGTIRVLLDSVTFTGVPGLQSSDFSSGVGGLELQQSDAPPGTVEPIFHP